LPIKKLRQQFKSLLAQRFADLLSSDYYKTMMRVAFADDFNKFRRVSITV
jgi:hypothetical protein